MVPELLNYATANFGREGEFKLVDQLVIPTEDNLWTWYVFSQFLPNYFTNNPDTYLKEVKGFKSSKVVSHFWISRIILHLTHFLKQAF